MLTCDHSIVIYVHVDVNELLKFEGSYACSNLGTMIGENFGHIRLRSKCLQAQPVTC